MGKEPQGLPRVRFSAARFGMRDEISRTHGRAILRAAVLVSRGPICMSCMSGKSEAQIRSMSSANEESSARPRVVKGGRQLALPRHARCC